MKILIVALLCLCSSLFGAETLGPWKADPTNTVYYFYTSQPMDLRTSGGNFRLNLDGTIGASAYSAGKILTIGTSNNFVGTSFLSVTNGGLGYDWSGFSDGQVPIKSGIAFTNDLAIQANLTTHSVGVGMAPTGGKLDVLGDVISRGYLWTVRTSAADSNWNSVAYGNGVFVAVGTTGAVQTSPDGVNWYIQTASAANNWNGIAFGNGLFVAVGSSGSGNRVMTSSDGFTWTSRTSAANNSWISVTYGKNLFVAVANNGTVMSSPDGITWTLRTTSLTNAWQSVCYANVYGGLFVAVGSTGTGNRVMTSSDGITWASQTSAEDNVWSGVAYGNGLFVAVSQGGAGSHFVMTSPDGTNWTARTQAASIQWSCIAYGDGNWVALANTGTGNRAMTSPDGINWTSRSSAANNSWGGIAYGNGIFVGVSYSGTGNRVMTSGKQNSNPTILTSGGTSVAVPITTTNGGFGRDISGDTPGRIYWVGAAGPTNTANLSFDDTYKGIGLGTLADPTIGFYMDRAGAGVLTGVDSGFYVTDTRTGANDIKIGYAATLSGTITGTSETRAFWVNTASGAANNWAFYNSSTAKNQLGSGSTYLGTLLVGQGTGSPQSAVTAPVGSLYLRTDGSWETTVYAKTNGTGNTGWTALIGVDTSGGGGGGALVGTVINVGGASVAGGIPSYSDTTATNITALLSTGSGKVVESFASSQTNVTIVGGSFTTMTNGNATPSQPAVWDGNKVLTSGAIPLGGGTSVSGTLSEANGGTGANLSSAGVNTIIYQGSGSAMAASTLWGIPAGIQLSFAETSGVATSTPLNLANGNTTGPNSVLIGYDFATSASVVKQGVRLTALQQQAWTATASTQDGEFDIATLTDGTQSPKLKIKSDTVQVSNVGLTVDNLTASTLVGTDGSKVLNSITVGSGLSLVGTTLSASGGGGITGSGAANQVTTWSSSSAVTGGNDFRYINTSSASQVIVSNASTVTQYYGPGYVFGNNAQSYLLSTDQYGQASLVTLNADNSINTPVWTVRGSFPTPTRVEFMQGVTVDGVSILGAAQTVTRTASSGSLTLGDSHYYVFSSATSTKTLPSAASVGAGRVYIIKSGTGAITTIATTGGDTVDGTTPATIIALSSRTFISDGVSNWEIN